MISIYEFLNRANIEYHENFDVSVLSSIKIGGKCKLVIFPHSVCELEKLLMFFYSNKIYYRVLGNASNVLFTKEIGYPLVFTSKMIDEVEFKGNIVTVSAGMLISRFAEILKKHKLSGFEGLVNIPATIGGATITNAGAYGYSISDYIVSVKVFFDGKILVLDKNEIKFGYHYSNLKRFIVLSVTFWFENKNEYDIINLSNRFTYMRGKSQPSGLSLGSVYRKINSKSAGFYIERAGLKGLKIGGIVVSNKHSNFFVNDGGGSAIDFLSLCKIVETKVQKQFGLELVTEVEQIGDRDEINFRLPHTFKI